ncbi:MAG: toxin-antitoxin system YwqK family antitoxin [Cetobacterium sp.]|uniref:toxin-antitoxin system YwqK family antitoxin n=1 Tax=Cetobacterium sp. TaxID=2071632 RepID=UPI003F39571D
MKKEWVISCSIVYMILFNLSFSNLRKESVDKKSIKNQIVYLQNEQKPFTGQLFGLGIKEQYETGVKNGFFQGFFYDGGKKYIYEGNYINGIKHGTWTLKYLNGEIRAALKYNYDKPYGQWTYFFESKNIEGYESLEDGILHGKLVRYSETGDLIIRTNYLNGLLDGETTFFHKKEILETLTNFKYGKIDGSIKIFSSDGLQILEGNYKNDKREGVWKFFYKTGDLKTLVNYKNGLKDGEVIIYDKAGLIVQKIKFIKGNEIDSDGKVTNKNSEFKDPIVDRFKKFNRNLKYEVYDKILSEME